MHDTAHVCAVEACSIAFLYAPPRYVYTRACTSIAAARVRGIIVDGEIVESVPRYSIIRIEYRDRCLPVVCVNYHW